MNNPEERPYLTVSDVGEMLNLGNAAVKRIPASDLPYWRIGRRGDRRYSILDLQRYLENHKVNTNGQ